MKQGRWSYKEYDGDQRLLLYYLCQPDAANRHTPFITYCIRQSDIGGQL